MKNANSDIYQTVTDRIIAAIEAGTVPWQKPWSGSCAGTALPVRFNGVEYQGINVLMLWATAFERGYMSNHWMTYRQAQELGGQVEKGQKSTTVVKFGTIEKDGADAQAEKETKRVSYTRAYRVFNADQIAGLPDRFYTRPEPAEDFGTEPIPHLEKFFAATGFTIKSSDEPRAYYRISEDSIHMPPIATFISAASYYGTLAHECVHLSGSKSRLDRFGRFEDMNSQCFEELVAEIGNAMLCAKLGSAPEIDQNAAYITHWLKAMKGDNRVIFRAASEAQKAVNFILEAAAGGGFGIEIHDSKAA